MPVFPVSWEPAMMALTRHWQRQVRKEVEARGRTMPKVETKPRKVVFHLWNANYNSQNTVELHKPKKTTDHK